MATYTQLQYTTLCAAIAQGALEVTYGDKKAVYRSLKEMLTLKGIMETDLGLNGTNAVNRGRRYGEFSNGLQ